MSTEDTGSNHAPTPEEIEADIARQREHLADTVDALQDKLDVKSRAQAKARDVQQRLTDSQGKPRTDVVAGAATAVVVFAGGLVWLRTTDRI